LASSTISFHLSLSNANPTGRRWKFNPAEFLVASQHFRLYRVGLSAPRPTHTPEDQASAFTSPRGRVAQLYPQAPANHFSRLLRHAWVTVGLYLFPGHHTGNSRNSTGIIKSIFK
jgi:hypothetical protein